MFKCVNYGCKFYYLVLKYPVLVTHVPSSLNNEQDDLLTHHLHVTVIIVLMQTLSLEMTSNP